MESPLCSGVPTGTRLIETFGWTAQSGFRHLDRHLRRMMHSAAALGFDFDRDQAMATLQVSGSQPLRCRLTLGTEGFDFTTAPLAENPTLWHIAISDQCLTRSDPWLGHKTTNRAIYDTARANMVQALDEIIFFNDQNALCEGTITNVFVQLADGSKVTPPLSCGLLPGIQREIQLENGYKERIITKDMLQNASFIWCGNSLRGMIPAVLVTQETNREPGQNF